jgi:hypothetical protein
VHGAERRTADGRILQQPVPDVHHLRERLLPLVERIPACSWNSSAARWRCITAMPPTWSSAAWKP